MAARRSAGVGRAVGLPAARQAARQATERLAARLAPPLVRRLVQRLVQRLAPQLVRRRIGAVGWRRPQGRAPRLVPSLFVALTLLAASAAAQAPAAPAACRGALYLTLDTGNMRHAEDIAAILRRHAVRATFFLANERTTRGDYALDPSWADYWTARAAEGHAFGTHTWRHGRFLADRADGSVRYRPQFGADAGRPVWLDPPAVCAELKSVDERLRALAGRGVDALWRAPGGYTTPNTLAAAHGCGFAHVHWAPAGFLGDELPSDRYPNRVLLDRALRDLRDGDVIMAHLGIWSRQDPFAPMLDPLIAGLRQRGMCFRPLTEHPAYRREAAPLHLAAQAPRATAP